MRSKANSILFLRNHLVCCVDEVSFGSVKTNLASSVNFYKDCTGMYRQVCANRSQREKEFDGLSSNLHCGAISENVTRATL